jgi:hypothetical protein
LEYSIDTVFEFILSLFIHLYCERREHVSLNLPILVTGGAGFIGSAFVLQWLAEQRSAVTVPNLVPILTADYPNPAKRPANSRLSC